MIPRAILGACVGDAAGAVLEFSDGPIPLERVQWALQYPGGGPHRLGRGQITDDAELTLALWQALTSTDFPQHECVLDGNGQGRPIRTECLMKAYADWLYSVPFDVGSTCRNAFEYYVDVFDGSMSVSDATQRVIEENRQSEANGALMRATAIASYVDQYYQGNPLVAVEIAKQDALLSHPSIVCQETSQIYVYALVHLLKGADSEEVLLRLDRFIKRAITSETVRRWFYEESLDLSGMDCTQQEGHVRWAFVMAMYFLRHPEIGFEEALTMVLQRGGDTDTNACIVGGLVACYQPVPERLSAPVLAFDSTLERRDRRWRPAEYCVGKVFGFL
jgi:ADP-ribosyl-[dinitrogen reductase] hydrolase